MTRLNNTSDPRPTRPPRDVDVDVDDARAGRWRLHDAKARFSELVRRARSDGPQHVTVHGRDEVVVLSADAFRQLKGEQTGEALVLAMQASPHRDIDIEPRRLAMPARPVEL